jgi:hypothetical protein
VIDWLPNGLILHNLEPPRGLIECDTVLDIGCGLRPMNWYTPRHHICVEPHQPYLDRIAAVGGYECVLATASEALSHVKPGKVDAIYLLDVIEHMTREDGHNVIRLTLMAQPKQIVIFTPVGYMKQDGADPWGLDGDKWQRHRSGWTPEDFDTSWATSFYGRGFFAVWTNGEPKLLTA